MLCPWSRNLQHLKAMENLARKRIEALPRSTLTSLSDDEKRNLNVQAVSIIDLLKGLAKSSNPLGKKIAEKLQDEFTKQFSGSEVGQPIIDYIGKEVGPLLPSKSGRNDDPTHESAPTIEAPAKSAAPPKASAIPVSSQTHQRVVGSYGCLSSSWRGWVRGGCSFASQSE